MLILKVEENMQHCWHISLYDFKKGKNATETQKKTSAVYEEDAHRMCQKWFAKFLGTMDILAK